MTRAECFRLLNLPSGSTDAEIRKQYKKLALRLHPDVNPDPLAHEVFIKLGRAVEILLNPDYQEEKAPVRTTRRAGKESEEELKERMRTAKMRFEQQKMQQAKDNNAYFLSLTTGWRWRIYKYVLAVSLILSLVLTAEFFLPHHFEHDVLTASSKFKNNGIIKGNITRIDLEKRGLYYVQNSPGAWNNAYPEVIIETTWFLHTPVKMISSDDFTRFRTIFDFHVGSIRYGLIILFLVPLYPYFWRRKTLNFVFLYHVSFWGIGIITSYLLLTQDRFIHLLTLGFL